MFGDAYVSEVVHSYIPQPLNCQVTWKVHVPPRVGGEDERSSSTFAGMFRSRGTCGEAAVVKPMEVPRRRNVSSTKVVKSIVVVKEVQEPLARSEKEG